MLAEPTRGNRAYGVLIPAQSGGFITNGLLQCGMLVANVRSQRHLVGKVLSAKGACDRSRIRHLNQADMGSLIKMKLLSKTLFNHNSMPTTWATRDQQWAVSDSLNKILHFTAQLLHRVRKAQPGMQRLRSFTREMPRRPSNGTSHLRGPQSCGMQ